MKTEKGVRTILLAAIFLCAAPAAFRAEAQTTITFTIVPEESPVVTTATLKYLSVELLTETAQRNLEGSVQLVLDPSTGTLHTLQVVSMDVDMPQPISFTASRDVGAGVSVELTVSLTSITITLTGESTATLVDMSGSATITLHEIEIAERLEYDYRIDFPFLPDVTGAGPRTIRHSITDPFTLTISPVTDIDSYTTLTVQFHLEDSINENLGDGFSTQIALGATITGRFAPPQPPPTAVKDFDLYDRKAVWGNVELRMEN